MPDLDVEAMAYHEAGHAVVARHFGFELLALYINGKGTKKGGLWCDPPHPRAYTTRQDSNDFTDEDKSDMFADVCHLLAGSLAEKVVFDNSRNPSWCGDDNAEIEKISRWHFPDDGNALQEFLDRAAQETRRILEDSSPRVTSLAKMLLRQPHRLWGDEIEKIIG